ncbi:MAG: DMT family transporter [Candidatus Pelethousia sp.]|nr:DMT family transporter [Candidatus Pelethousia sp.]
MTEMTRKCKEVGRSDAKSLIQIHVAVFFLGLSALAGKWSTLNALSLTFGRVWVSSPALFLYLKMRRMPMRLHSRRDYGVMAVLGGLWAVHWVAFLQSAQLATVAIATITFSTYPVFVTFLEPWLFHERLRLSAVVEALLMLAGASIIVPWQADGALLPGFIWGMAASVLHAAIVLLNRRMVVDYSGEVVAFYSQASAALLLLPAGIMLRPAFTGHNLTAVLVLGLLCSALAQALVGCGLKRVKAQTLALIGGLESVYGIVLAAILLAQPPTLREILGGVVVLGVSMYATLEKQTIAQRGMKEKT